MNALRVLVACEESQAVCKAFRKRGYEAFSCDLQECSGGHPEWHVQDDCLTLLGGWCTFITMDGAEHCFAGSWDLIIAHPPCTFLTSSGNRWFSVEKYGEKAIQRKKNREEAFGFFMKFVNAPCKHIAIENPVGYANTHYRKPDQIIQPYMFGEHAKKSTCLWLKGLPKLKPTNIVDPGEIDKYGCSVGASANYAKDENGKILAWNDPRTAIIRSRTFPGIAEAMAEEWGNFLQIMKNHQEVK